LIGKEDKQQKAAYPHFLAKRKKWEKKMPRTGENVVQIHKGAETERKGKDEKKEKS